jgi:hypothetical protein
MIRLGRMLPFSRVYERFSKHEEDVLLEEYREIVDKEIEKNWKKHL